MPAAEPCIRCYNGIPLQSTACNHFKISAQLAIGDFHSLGGSGVCKRATMLCERNKVKGWHTNSQHWQPPASQQIMLSSLERRVARIFGQVQISDDRVAAWMHLMIGDRWSAFKYWTLNLMVCPEILFPPNVNIKGGRTSRVVAASRRSWYCFRAAPMSPLWEANASPKAPASAMAMLVDRSPCGVVGCAASPISATCPQTHCCRGSRSKMALMNGDAVACRAMEQRLELRESILAAFLSSRSSFVAVTATRQSKKLSNRGT